MTALCPIYFILILNNPKEELETLDHYSTSSIVAGDIANGFEKDLAAEIFRPISLSFSKVKGKSHMLGLSEEAEVKRR